MIPITRLAVLLLFVMPTLVALLVVTLGGMGVISFRASQGDIVEIGVDAAVRSLLAVGLLQGVRWSYRGSSLYLVLLSLYAAGTALVSKFSAVDGVLLGALLLINGTTLWYLHALAMVPDPALGVRRAAKVIQAVGAFLVIGSIWGGVIAAFVVLLVFGAGLIPKGKK